MHNAKLRMTLALLASIVGLLCAVLFVGAAPAKASAAEIVSDDPASGAELPEEEGEEGDLAQGLMEAFLLKLKARCGEDYERYLNAILEQWGSVENYLLSLTDEEDPQSGWWRTVIVWLDEYKMIWGSALAVGLVVLAIVLGKKTLKQIGEWFSGYRKNTQSTFESFNKLYVALNAQSKALTQLLAGERFSEAREELQKSMNLIEEEDDGGV